MKTRMGFVSNSSSSSFLILGNGIEDFKDFQEIDGYKILSRNLKNIKKDNENNCRDHIFSTIQNYFWRMMYKISKEKVGYSPFYERIDFEKMLEDFNIGVKNCPLLEMVFKYSNKLRAYADSLNVSGKNTYDKEYKICEKLKAYSDKIAPNAEQIESLVDQIYDYLKSKGNLFEITYYDDTDDGSYMEHDFMQYLIECSKDHKFKIHCLNQH